MEKLKCYTFNIRGTASGSGYVYAKDEKEAEKKIRVNDVFDIIDEDIEWDYSDFEITEVDEGESESD